MKNYHANSHLTIYRTRQPMYPGAADDSYFSAKALDILTALVSCMGLVTATIFLVTLC